MLPISVTLVTGPMRETMPSDVTGSSVCCPKAVLWGCTVRRLPSWPSSLSRPVLEDWEMPSTPTMAAMPMLMPSADSAARTRRLRSPRLPTRTRSRRDSREAPVSCAGRRITDDPPVPDLDAPLHGRGHLVVVGYHHDGRAVPVQLVEQFQKGRAGGGVQVPGRLVGHDQGGPPGQGPGDGGTLLLAARQLVRPVVKAVAHPDPFEGRLCQPAALGGPPAPVEQAVGDVVEHGQAVEQEELLEDEAEAPGTQARQLRVRHGRGVLPGDPDPAACRPFEGAHHVQQGALARPGRADDGDQLALVDPQADASQGHDRRVARILLHHVGQLKDTHRTGIRPGRDRDRLGHGDGTSTSVPTVIPDPLTWTSVSLYRPVLTPVRWLVLPVTTSTPYPPPASASSAFTGTARTLPAVWVVMLTFTGAWSMAAPGGVLSRVMVTGTVGVEVVPDPPDSHGDWSAEPSPPPAPMPPPPGQVATVPTVSM